MVQFGGVGIDDKLECFGWNLVARRNRIHLNRGKPRVQPFQWTMELGMHEWNVCRLIHNLGTL
jgi:hypothetical protein